MRSSSSCCHIWIYKCKRKELDFAIFSQKPYEWLMPRFTLGFRETIHPNHLNKNNKTKQKNFIFFQAAFQRWLPKSILTKLFNSAIGELCVCRRHLWKTYGERSNRNFSSQCHNHVQHLGLKPRRTLKVWAKNGWLNFDGFLEEMGFWMFLCKPTTRSVRIQITSQMKRIQIQPLFDTWPKYCEFR